MIFFSLFSLDWALQAQFNASQMQCLNSRCSSVICWYTWEMLRMFNYSLISLSVTNSKNIQPKWVAERGQSASVCVCVCVTDLESSLSPFPWMNTLKGRDAESSWQSPCIPHRTHCVISPALPFSTCFRSCAERPIPMCQRVNYASFFFIFLRLTSAFTRILLRNIRPGHTRVDWLDETTKAVEQTGYWEILLHANLLSSLDGNACCSVYPFGPDKQILHRHSCPPQDPSSDIKIVFCPMLTKH